MNEREEQEGREAGSTDDPLVEEQEGKGYGEDEGERDEALEQENWENL